MADINTTKLKGCYARLKGLERAIPLGSTTVKADLGNSYNQILEQLKDAVGNVDDFSSFSLGAGTFYSSDFGQYCETEPLRSNLLQLIEYLEMIHQVGRQVIEVGTLYNALHDEELKTRVSDLLSAPGNFDRAINQATQVLEDRIRKKSGADGSLTGKDLVNQMIKANPAESVIKVSEVPSEQEGFANLCRGTMLAFRNPTHHQITDQFSREDALKICGCVDVLLGVLDKSSA